ncbi:kanadaptin-like [Planoprotostelium fungivorum]|uniref:Kanadaptin-like n=1 Tax=Planoprotostelium fungivorum TaxID=1890364 RepID=A0A2P6MT28_9EUKA|nr:kanadaptin-like [Planoprotostelium fungivorum]
MFVAPVGRAKTKGTEDTHPTPTSSESDETSKAEDVEVPVESEKIEAPSPPTAPYKVSLKYTEPPWGGEKEETPAFQLAVIKNGVQCDTLPLQGKSFSVVGRLPMCDVTLDHGSISRQHAVFQLRKEDGFLFLYDLGSTHGTFQNKKRLTPNQYYQVQQGHIDPISLTDLITGDFLRFGESSRMFIVEGGPLKHIDEKEEEERIQKGTSAIRARQNHMKLEQMVKQSQHLRKLDEEAAEEKNAAREGKEEETKPLTEEEELEKNGDWSETVKTHELMQGIEEEDDDDDFYDRTEKKKKGGAKTHAQLVAEAEELQSNIDRLQGRVDTIAVEEKSGENEDDALDAFMKDMDRNQHLNEKNNLQREIDRLKREKAEIDGLIRLTAPAVQNEKKREIPKKTEQKEEKKGEKENKRSSEERKREEKKEEKEEKEEEKEEERETKKKKVEVVKKEKKVFVPQPEPEFVEEFDDDDDYSEVPTGFYKK